MNYNRPKVGMGVIILNDKYEILIGKRKDNNLFALPGGHLEKFEEVTEGISREILEETNLNINPNKIYEFEYINCYRKEIDYHYFNIILLC